MNASNEYPAGTHVTNAKLKPFAEQLDSQYGLLTRQQLLDADLGQAWIDRAARGWPTILPGVYVKRPMDDFRQRAMAAVLRWPGCCLSHVVAGRVQVARPDAGLVAPGIGCTAVRRGLA